MAFAREKNKTFALMLERKLKISAKLYEKVIKTPKETLKTRLKTRFATEKQNNCFIYPSVEKVVRFVKWLSYGLCPSQSLTSFLIRSLAKKFVIKTRVPLGSCVANFIASSFQANILTHQIFFFLEVLLSAKIHCFTTPSLSSIRTFFVSNSAKT